MVKHVLKSGKTVDSIRGHKLRRSEAGAVYLIIENQKKQEVKNEKKDSRVNYRECYRSRAL